MSEYTKNGHWAQHDSDNDEKIQMSPYIVGYQEKKLPEVNDDNDEISMWQRFINRNKIVLYYCRLALINIIAGLYFAYATYIWLRKNETDLKWCTGYGLLVLIYVLVYGRLIYIYGFQKFCCKPLGRVFLACLHSFGYKNGGKSVGVCLSAIISVSIIAFLIYDTWDSRSRLIGFLGIFLTMALGWCFSKHPTKVSWKPMVWGLIIQFILGIVSTKWTIGRSIFLCLSDKIVAFLDYSKNGAKFVFSEQLVDNGVFAFTVFPTIIFFSFVISILYNLGVMQYMIKKIGWLLSVILGTTACESLHAATTLFLGLPESFLVIEPYLNKLTKSELHAIMCSCFSTISGTTLSAYMSYGVQPMHLITAMLMSAPAGLCFAKLLYPETKKSSTEFKNIVLKKAHETTLLDAATEGALSAIPLVLGCAANVIAFVSAIAFLNAICSWFGYLVGFPNLTFELILAKIFTPISFVLGVPWEECETVGSLIGLKTVVNELIAYQRFGQVKKTIGLSAKAEVIATYALCGFSNPGSLGVCVGSLSTMASDKKSDISDTVMRAFVGGIAVCFLTACIAGILVPEEPVLNELSLLSNTNSTSLIL